MKQTVIRVVTTVILLSLLVLAPPPPPLLDTIEEVQQEGYQTPESMEEPEHGFQGHTSRRPAKLLVRLPYPVPDPDALPSVRPRQPRSGLPRWISRFGSSTSSDRPPATNGDMARLVKGRPYRVYLSQELLAITETEATIDGQKVVQLPGGELGREVLTLMTRKGEAFFVQGGNGKVWHFTKSGPNSFVYSDEIGLRDMVRIRQLIGGRWEYSSPWWRKLANASRGLRKAWASLKAFHRL